MLCLKFWRSRVFWEQRRVVLSCIRDFNSETMVCLNKLPISEELKSTLLNNESQSTGSIGKKNANWYGMSLSSLSTLAWCALPTCRDINGVSRRADIFAFNRSSSKGYIIDSTIRTEEEKKEIHGPWAPYFCDMYGISEEFLKGFKIPLEYYRDFCFYYS